MSTEFCCDKTENQIVEVVPTIKMEEHTTELQPEMKKTDTETKSDKVIKLNPSKEKKKKRDNKIIIGLLEGLWWLILKLKNK